MESVWGLYPGAVGYLHCSVPTRFPVQAQHAYHTPENIWKVYRSSKGIWSGNLILRLPTEPHSNRALQTWLSRFTCLDVQRIINILAKKEGRELQRLFVQVLGKLCLQDHSSSWEIPFEHIPSSQVSFIHEQIEFMEIVNSILGSQNSISTPRFIAAAERHSVVI